MRRRRRDRAGIRHGRRLNPLPEKPEILAPAGGRAQLEAAVWAGADAVYFGLDHGLNARVRATSFKLDELDATMAFLHERGVRGYLALNTLVFDEELADAERLVRRAALAGVDALIVQDIGLTRLARAVAPHLPLHGSTQMSISDANGIAFAAELGVERVVVGRELSVDEITRVIEHKAARYGDIGIEVFVHGALCVSYSGQCFSSEAWGGRSANRGQCAQACRLPYGLLVDGVLREQGDRHYLLSPQDLMAVEVLPRLVRAGVQSFKIEGRLKGPEYVIATVATYREALDRIWSGIHDSPDTGDYTLDNARRRQLAQVFSRGQDASSDGLTPGFLLGPRHQSLVLGRNPKHRGLYIGEVTGHGERGISTTLNGPLKRGDGVVFEKGQAQGSEIGGNIHHVLDNTGHSIGGEIDHGEVELYFGPDFRHDAVSIGERIWRTRDSARDGGTTLDPRLAARRVPVAVRLTGQSARALQLILEDDDGHSVELSSNTLLQPASGRPLDEAALRKAIGILGDSPFHIATFAADLEPGLFLPLSEVKALRREAVGALLRLRRHHQRSLGLAGENRLPALLPEVAAGKTSMARRLSLLCRTREQVDAALQLDGVDEIIVDFLEVHGLKEACAAVNTAGRTLIVAAPRIFKPGEERLWRYLCRLNPDGLLVRSAGLLQVLQQHGGAGALLDDDTRIPALHGDFSLNAANVLAAQHLFDGGITRLTPTHDLNAQQIAALARGLPADRRDRLEVIVHQHLPIFHTEYCVFARFLSSGDSYRDCGRPCEQHVVHLRDPAGGDHLVQADIGCRNTVFNAAAQSAVAVLGDLVGSGLSRFRIELVDEPAGQVAAVVAAYRRHLAGMADPKALLRELAKITDVNGRPQGVGPGSLAVRIESRRETMKKPTAR